MKTQLKILFFLVLSITLILSLFGGSVYYFLYNYSYTDFYKRLETRAIITAKYNFDLDNQNSESFKIIREEHLEKLTHEKEYLYQITNQNDLKDIAEKSMLPLNYLNTIYLKGKANLQRGETFYSGVKYDNGRHLYIVVISAEHYYATHHLLFFRKILLAGIGFIILITFSLSVYFSKHIFDPIKKITNKVQQISTDNIHLRLKESGDDNEISQLVSTFNNLLNRLETAFETQKNFISNASHEFGTPLTTIMGEAEVMLRKERMAIEYQQSLKIILEQAERLNEVTQSLLFLAQTGYKKNSLNFELLRTDEILWEVKEIIDKLNPHNKIQFDLSLLPDNPYRLKVYGNKQLLYLAFSNLLNNACKYSNNQPVILSIASSDTQIFVVIIDQGIGIPETELQFIYDPFFRASNTHQFEGYGIGLPLSRNIIKIHQGDIQVSTRLNEGTTVQVKLPLAFPRK